MNRILLYKMKNRIKRLLTGKKVTDDFDWGLYPVHYRGELDKIAKIRLQVLSPGEYAYQEGVLQKNKNTTLDLHPNHRLLYETILQLSPSTVMEIGCGGGDHLKNISLLAPQIDMHGRDLSFDQLSFAGKRHPDLKAELDQLDATLPLPLTYPGVEVVYTQAVIQHIKTGKAHMVALANLFRIASSQVVLVENWSCHDFKQDIEFLFNRGNLPWEHLYLYYRKAVENPQTGILIASAYRLTEYNELDNYSLLTD